MTEQNVAMMAEVIRVAVEEGSMRPVDPERAAFILFVGGQTLFNQERYSYSDVLPVYVDIIMNGRLRR